MRNRHIYIFTTYLLHRYCPDRFLTMGLKTRLNRLAKSALLSVSNPVFSTLHIETNPLLYVASSSGCKRRCPNVYFAETLFNAGVKIEILKNRSVRRNRSNNCIISLALFVSLTVRQRNSMLTRNRYC